MCHAWRTRPRTLSLHTSLSPSRLRRSGNGLQDPIGSAAKKHPPSSHRPPLSLDYTTICVPCRSEKKSARAHALATIADFLCGRRPRSPGVPRAWPTKSVSRGRLPFLPNTLHARVFVDILEWSHAHTQKLNKDTHAHTHGPRGMNPSGQRLGRLRRHLPKTGGAAPYGG